MTHKKHKKIFPFFFLYLVIFVQMSLEHGDDFLDHGAESTPSVEDLNYIYIDRDPSIPITLAEPHTLPSIKDIKLVIKSTMTPINYDIIFVWTILPADNNRFFATENYGTIQRQTNSTQITISIKDSTISSPDIELYTFNLDKIINSFNTLSLNDTFYIHPNAKTAQIKLLPSNYPFGLFEFSSEIPANLTISRYTQSTLADSIQIDRKFGKNYRILLTYEQIEYFDNSMPKKFTKYLEFQNGESQKSINFTSVYKSESSLDTQISYPRVFCLNLTSVQILDSLKIDEEFLVNSTDILPKLGKKEKIFISVIDDVSLIEFASNLVEIYTESRYDSSHSIQVSLSVMNKLNTSVYVNFITVPTHKTLHHDTHYFAARPNLDYSPTGGRFIFTPESQTAQVQFLIHKNDDHYYNNYNKAFVIHLISVENCANCKLGLNNQAFVYINWLKSKFRSLTEWQVSYQNLKSTKDLFKNKIEWNIPINDTIYANVPKYSDQDKVTDTKICVKSLVKTPLKIDLEIILLDVNNPIGDQIRVYLTDTVVILDSNHNDFCLSIMVEILDPIYSAYCYNIPYLVNLNTYHIISKNLELYSQLVSIDSFDVLISNLNCSYLTMDPDNLTLNKSKEFLRENSQIYLDTSKDSFYLIEIPLLLQNNLSDLDEFNFTYEIELDSFITNFLRFNQADEFTSRERYTSHGFSTLFIFNSTFNPKKNNSINFSLENLKNFEFYLINIRIRINYSNMGIFMIKKIAEDTGVLKSDSVTLDFIIKSNDLCGIIGLDRNLTQFFLINSKRELLIYFSDFNLKSLSQQEARMCQLNLIYTISKSEENEFSSGAAQAYLQNESDNYVHVFTPNEKNFKTIEINNDVYMDQFDLFMINLTSVYPFGNQKKGFIRSSSDSYMIVRPSSDISNGKVQIATEISYSNLEELVLNLKFIRTGTYRPVAANYKLYFSESNSTNEIKVSNTILKSGEKTNKIQVSLASFLLNKQYYGDLILYGNECFLNSANSPIDCTEEKAKILVEADGFFFSQTNLLLLN